MALNKNALIRYKTIDKCLQNRYRQWTLNDLIEACSDALYDYEGRDVNVSRRSVQLDIQMMRSDKLGYNAPIEVYERKYYRYADENYSITNTPLTETDMHVLSESVEMLKQFKDFSLFAELGGIIQRLEDTVYVEKTNQNAIIHLDKNEQLRGLEHLDTLYQAILKKTVLTIDYQSFRARKPQQMVFHPFILKEFNNRWFVVGRQEGHDRIMTLALDRIESIDYKLDVEYRDEQFDGDSYYQHTVGVTVLPPEEVKTVELRVDRANAPYVLTKPFHHSQVLQSRNKDGSINVTLRVHLNLELERLLLGFGNSLEVIKPTVLRNRMKHRLKLALQQYEPKTADNR